MARHLTLGRIAQQIQTMTDGNHDQQVHSGRIRFQRLDQVTIDGQAHPISPNGVRQFCHRLGVPAGYLAKCPPSLQAGNLNHWLRQADTDLFVRFDREERVRAVFTPRYVPVDHRQVVERLLASGFSPSAKVRCWMDEEFLSLAIPDAEHFFEARPNDPISPGVSISNSETGRSSLRIASYFLRLVCTNGLIATDQVAMAFRHVSARFLVELPSIISQTRAKTVLAREQFLLSASSPLDDPQASIARFNRQFQLTIQEAEAVDWGWEHEPGTSMFHLINAYTKAAQHRGLNVESRNRLERVGGLILGAVR